MSKFLALIMVAAMALFTAGQAVADPINPEPPDEPPEGKSVWFGKFNDIDVTKNITVNKSLRVRTDVTDDEISDSGQINVDGDAFFGEMDLEMQEDEVINKFFELDDSASSTWSVDGELGVNVLEQLQVGDDNSAQIDQLTFSTDDALHVGLQYQFGVGSIASIQQTSVGGLEGQTSVDSNNFAKQVQIGAGNDHAIVQNLRSLPQ